MINFERIAGITKGRRKQLGLTQAEAAEKAGVSRQYWCLLEMQQSADKWESVSFCVLDKIAEVIDFPLALLLDQESEAGIFFTRLVSHKETDILPLLKMVVESGAVKCTFRDLMNLLLFSKKMGEAGLQFSTAAIADILDQNK